MKKINIVPTQIPIKLVTMEYPPTRGGAGTYCDELAHATNELSMDIEVLAPLGSHSVSSVKLIQLPFKGSQGWICSLKIIKFLKKQSLEKIALHIADPGSLRAMVRFGWALPKPAQFIITIHGSEIPKFSRNPIERIFFRNLLRKADRIHILSKYNQEKLTQFCPSLKYRIQLVQGAPARNTLPVSDPSEERNYAKKKLVLLCVGRIHPRKGQLELLSSIGRLPDFLKQRIECKFVGPATKQGYAKKVFEKSKSIGCKVEFLGDINCCELEKVYQRSDIFALTSIPMHNSVEGFGFVYLEASAHGLPILAHCTGGVEDAVLHQKTGLLSEPSKPEQLDANLSTLMENQELRESLGKAGKVWATTNCWTKIAKKIYEFDKQL